MKSRSGFLKEVCVIAIPVALQCMLQSSFSIVDQLMIGQLGSVSIAAIGFAAKFSTIFTVVIGAICSVAGIMVSQYIGAEDRMESSRSMNLNILVALMVSIVFFLLCLFIPTEIMSRYSTDAETIDTAAMYLRVISISFIPIAINSCASVLFRCCERAQIPLYISITGAILNTLLNYVLIFGRFGFPELGVLGAAMATVLSTIAMMIATLVMYLKLLNESGMWNGFSISLTKMSGNEYMVILFPILLNEFLWSLGENIYASVYGHIGTMSSAAMTLTNPIQGLIIGGLSGIAQAAGIIVGKRLGKEEYDDAYNDSKKLILYGFVGSLVMSVLIIIMRSAYISIFNVEDEVIAIGKELLLVFAIFAPVKIQNMILGGGIIRSGGKTKIVMIIDLIGTWLIGVPVALFTAYVLKLPIAWVYFALSMEEVVRLIISMVIFRNKIWMQTI